MFERYTERARRVIFFARYEASQYGSQTIETEHLLLGLLREDLNVLKGLLIPSPISLPQVRDEIERHMERRKSLSTSIEVPLSIESKRVLNHAAEEADRLGHKHIGTEHLLLGLVRGENSRASVILRHYGADAATIRSKVAEGLLLQWAPGKRAGGAIAALNSFLSSLKNRCNPELADFFAVNGQFVDTSRKMWFGREEIKTAVERLFARPMQKRIRPTASRVPFRSAPKRCWPRSCGRTRCTRIKGPGPYCE